MGRLETGPRIGQEKKLREGRGHRLDTMSGPLQTMWMKLETEPDPLNSPGEDSGWEHPTLSPEKVSELGQRSGREMHIHRLPLVHPAGGSKSREASTMTYFMDF